MLIQIEHCESTQTTYPRGGGLALVRDYNRCELLDFCNVLVMADMNNEFFFVLRKNNFLAVFFSPFFADVSKKRKTRYLKNNCSDFLDFFLQILAMTNSY